MHINKKYPISFYYLMFHNKLFVCMSYLIAAFPLHQNSSTDQMYPKTNNWLNKSDNNISINLFMQLVIKVINKKVS